MLLATRLAVSLLMSVQAPDTALARSLVLAAHPAWQLRFVNGREAVVTDSRGTRETVGLYIEANPFDSIAVVALSYRDRTARADSAIQRFERVDRVPVEILYGRFQPGGGLRYVRTFSLDDEAVLVDIRDLRTTVSIFSTGAVPSLKAKYTSAYVGNGWYGTLDWESELALDPAPVPHSRLPHAFAIQQRGETDSRAGLLTPGDVDYATLELTMQAMFTTGPGRTSTRKFTVTLSDKVPLSGLKVLDLLRR